MSQKKDGFEYKTLQTYRFEQAQKPQKRIPENPIHVARMYLREREGERPKTYAEIAEKFGVSKVEVCYHIGLVNRLPEEFVSWLESQEEPDVLRVFTERRLRPITKLSGREEQRLRLRICKAKLNISPNMKKDEFGFEKMTILLNTTLVSGMFANDGNTH